MNEQLLDLYNDIAALEAGETVYNVIPDVPLDVVEQWKSQLVEEGFYVNVYDLGSIADIYYASPNYVEENYGEYTMGGWSN